jgi:hypothetical protein
VTRENLQITLDTLDALHTKAIAECRVRPAQAYASAMVLVGIALAAFEEAVL